MAFLNELKSQFETHRNESNIQQMETNMKHLFPFVGIKLPVRKAIS
ncbi:MAG: DNA alkylation repair protein [Winogradskyella sp.]|nr:DNA alkylation repair protein [Winogradskyella sp.]